MNIHLSHCNSVLNLFISTFQKVDNSYFSQRLYQLVTIASMALHSMEAQHFTVDNPRDIYS